MKRNNRKNRKNARARIGFAILLIACLVTSIIAFVNSRSKNDMSDSVSIQTISEMTEPTVEDLTAQIGGMAKAETKSEKEETNESAIKKSEKPCYSHDFEIPIGTNSKYSKKEITLLKKIVFAEARGEISDGQIGVVNAIINRSVYEGEFPDTIEGVIFDNSYGIKQFTPANVEEKQIYFTDEDDVYRTVEESDITDSVKISVERAIDGENPIGKRKYFYAPKWCSEEELAKRQNIPDAIQIGNLIFYGED